MGSLAGLDEPRAEMGASRTPEEEDSKKKVWGGLVVREEKRGVSFVCAGRIFPDPWKIEKRARWKPVGGILSGISENCWSR